MSHTLFLSQDIGVKRVSKADSAKWRENLIHGSKAAKFLAPGVQEILPPQPSE